MGNSRHAITAMATGRMKTVLIALHLSHMPGQRKLSGIYAFIGARQDWNVRIFRTQQEVESPAFLELLDGPVDGIVYSAAYSKSIFRKLADVRCPVVCMEHAPALLAPRKSQLVVIRNDSSAIARAALRTFDHHGKYASYAFVHDRKAWDWSCAREKAFRAVLPKATRLNVFGPHRSAGTGMDARALAGFLSALPKPAAVLATHDNRAVDVIAAAARAGLAVPDDVAVLGIDNDQFVCDNGNVKLSSVEPDHYSEGMAAARELDAMMNGRLLRKVKTVNFGVRQVVIRSSTRNIVPMGSLVARARDFIAEHAHEGIVPADVAHAIGVSLPLLYLRLKQSKMPGVAKMIGLRKLEYVRHLLETTDTPIAAIPALCGFKNANALKNLFTRRYGCPMRVWRKHRKGPSAIAVKRSDADLDLARGQVHDLELEVLEVA